MLWECQTACSWSPWHFWSMNHGSPSTLYSWLALFFSVSTISDPGSLANNLDHQCMGHEEIDPHTHETISIAKASLFFLLALPKLLQNPHSDSPQRMEHTIESFWADVHHYCIFIDGFDRRLSSYWSSLNAPWPTSCHIELTRTTCFLAQTVTNSTSLIIRCQLKSVEHPYL